MQTLIKDRSIATMLYYLLLYLATPLCFSTITHTKTTKFISLENVPEKAFRLKESTNEILQELNRKFILFVDSKNTYIFSTYLLYVFRDKSSFSKSNQDNETQNITVITECLRLSICKNKTTFQPTKISIHYFSFVSILFFSIFPV